MCLGLSIAFAVLFAEIASPSALPQDVPQTTDTFLDLSTLKNITTGPFAPKVSVLECNGTIWLPILKFFLINYVGHAFTVKLGAGYKTIYGILFGLLSLFQPYFALLLACRVMECFAVGEKDPLRRALRGGALCVVARTNTWRPKAGDEAYLWRSIPTAYADAQVQKKTKIIRYGGLELEYLSQDFVQIHGLCHLPKGEGYMLARLPSDYKVKWQKLAVDSIVVDEHPENTTAELPKEILESQVNIASSYSFVKTFIALVQLGTAIYAIWMVSKPDKQRFGYASYQLTVIPYVLMSVINTVTSFTTPNYPASYLVRSSIMREAERRGAQFEGVVGELCESESKVSVTSVIKGHGGLVGAIGTFKSRTPGVGNDDLDVEFEEGNNIKELIQWPRPDERHERRSSFFAFFHAIKKALIFICRQQIWEALRDEAPIIRWPAMWRELAGAQTEPIPTAESESDPKAVTTKETTARVSTIATPTHNPAGVIRLTPHRTSIIRLFKISSEKKPTEENPNDVPIVLLPAIGNPTPREKSLTEKALFYVTDLIVFICLAGPYVATAYLTGYKNGDSSVYQRLFVMLWLVMMQVAYIPSRLTWSFLQTRIAPLTHRELVWGLSLCFIGGVIWSIPAMGGLVTVGIMMREEGGTCPDY